ncbi:Ig-like domain-containing protein [Patiriisocius hiemis]|uniref:Ig-like domain-containing protein n=1 Tax=Patiriisocius hiemis TaxID=3075604 RepID=A0ABU2YHD9_9FLAO|nr:Ig-like domain-containing protein [Constantimarinum sp. W242]MDT0556483.1 Ig-like domain-containing protein [Constantimarinum sp. W242]
MKHRLLYIPILFLFMLSFIDCAKKGNPSGGKKDSIPPVIVKSDPENFTTSFTEDEIKIYFDEYIKLEDLQKNLIISPPLKNQPIITPLSTSKVLKIKLMDTLRENTTYSINFGKSIVDNNEGNPYDYYKYVFSTGTFIDSLTLNGTIKDALLPSLKEPATVMLYEVNEEYTDSLVFKEKPFYISNTKEGSTFEFTNLKEGTYRLIALEDQNSDYIFQPSLDKIGYEEAFVTLPTDSSYTISLFKEDKAYRISQPKHVSKHSIIFGYEGAKTPPDISLISEKPQGHENLLFKDLKKDTLYYWFKPELGVDSLLFKSTYKETIDTLNLRIRDLFKDSLKINQLNAGTQKLRDTFKISANIPLITINQEKIKVTDKDTLDVAVNTILDTSTNTASINFPKTEDQKYIVTLLPGAITDYFETQNDTLQYGVRTKLVSDYGTITLTLDNVSDFPLVVQLVDSQFVVKDEKILTENAPLLFDEISPASYYLRVILDTNKNGKWDTGNFLKNSAPEKVIYYPSQIAVKANWSVNETFILSETNLDPVETVDDPEE